MADVRDEAEPVPACRFLIGRLMDPAPPKEGPNSIKDSRSPLLRSVILSLTSLLYHVEDERVAATEPE